MPHGIEWSEIALRPAIAAAKSGASAAQIARLLHTTEKAVRRLQDRGKIPRCGRNGRNAHNERQRMWRIARDRRIQKVIDDRQLTRSELAAHIGVTKQLVYRMERAGRIRFPEKPDKVLRA